MSNTASTTDKPEKKPAGLDSQAGQLQNAFQAITDNRVRIGFLLGNDVSATIAANAVIKPLVNAGYRPVIYMAKHKPSTKLEAKQAELQEFGFYERYLLNNVVKPHVDQSAPIQNEDGWPLNRVIYTPEQLAEIYNLEIETVENINAPEFIEKIKNDDLMPLLISIRCYQIAREGLINAQRDKTVNLRARPIQGNIWNLHPGKLPEYQGIFSPLYAMNELQRTAAWTLHEMIYDANDPNKGIDKGPIITRSTAPINYNRPAIELYTGFAQDSGRMTYSRIEDFMSGGVPTTPQNNATNAHQTQYYSHPSEEFFKDEWPTVHKRLIELADGAGFGIDPRIRMKETNHPNMGPKIADPQNMIDFYVQLFAGQDAQTQQALRTKITAEVENWEKNKAQYIKAHADQKYGAVDTMMMQKQSFLQWQAPQQNPAHNNAAATATPPTAPGPSAAPKSDTAQKNDPAPDAPQP